MRDVFLLAADSLLEVSSVAGEHHHRRARVPTPLTHLFYGSVKTSRVNRNQLVAGVRHHILVT